MNSIIMKLVLYFILAALVGLDVTQQSEEHEDEHDGFYLDSNLPDGNYQVTLQAKGTAPLIKRWEPKEKRWGHLQPRASREGAGSGEYTFVVDEDEGRVVDVSLDLYSQSKLPVPVTKTGCFHSQLYETFNYELDAEDYRHSKMAFYNWCDVYPLGRFHIEMALKGNVAVYVCTRGQGGSQFCSEAEYEDAEAHMNKTCGAAPAFTWIKSWNKEYGRSWKGQRICGKYGKNFRHPTPNLFDDNTIANGEAKLNRPLPLRHRPEWKYHGEGSALHGN